ncbi:hypothetical protein IWX85_001178 [Polaromonas sp. CG_9.11]|nr:hypothetical protein [Polaromonas sp. CG_9.11]
MKSCFLALTRMYLLHSNTFEMVNYAMKIGFLAIQIVYRSMRLSCFIDEIRL